MNTFEEVAQVWFSLIQWGLSIFVADAHLGTISYQVLRGREAPKKEMSMLSLRGRTVCVCVRVLQDHMYCIRQEP